MSNVLSTTLSDLNNFLFSSNFSLSSSSETYPSSSANDLNIPISYMGVGESYEDILDFNVDKYLDMLIKELNYE